MVFALIGNQNCGKTTLFNRLTGSNQHVGNFPGVTVDSKEGIIKGHGDMKVVDLPGIYSLSPYTAEEIVTRDFLINSHPDGVINIIDATNIERNLYLTLQTLSLEIPTVIALNMMDEVRENGTVIDVEKLSSLIGVPIVPVSAGKNEGISDLVSVLYETAKKGLKPKNTDFCSGAAHRAIHSVCHIIEDHADACKIPRRFAAAKLIEGDEIISKKLDLSPQDTYAIEHIITEMEQVMGMDREAALADTRYSFIESVCSLTVKKGREQTKQQKFSVKLDSVLTNKYLAIPIFLAIMSLVFYLTFGLIGNFLSECLSLGIDIVTDKTRYFLETAGVNKVFISLVIDGIFTGVGSVLSFLPVIVVLFYFLSVLEDSGYIARVAFFMDKLLRKIGLSGKSFVPMLIGFGCSVPAIMATRTLSSGRDRKMTIFLIPFMSCSAKLPVYSMIAYSLFKENAVIIMILMYIIGMVLAVLMGLLMKNTLFKGNSVPFVLELPSYRFPSLKTTALLMWDKTKEFLNKAFTVIFTATVIIWFLQNFDIKFNLADTDNSMLCLFGKFIAPVFMPLGFGNWKAVSALIAGFSAKEAVVSTLTVLMGKAPVSALFTPLSGFSFLVFTLVYTPCIAAVATVRNELGGKTALGMVIFQTVFAYLLSFLVYSIGNLIIPLI